MSNVGNHYAYSNVGNLGASAGGAGASNRV